MTAAAPYVQLQHSILADEFLVDVDGNIHHELLGWRVHLEILADAAWPAAAFIPADCPEWVLARLRDHEVLVPFPGGRFRLPAYDAARETRTRKAAIGGTARAEQAARSASGKFTSAATSDKDQRPLVANAGSDTTSERGQRAGQPPYNRQPKKNDVPRRDGVETSPTGARSPAPSQPSPSRSPSPVGVGRPARPNGADGQQGLGLQ